MATADKYLVTGCAGFLGSHLAEALLAADHCVVGVDCFTDYYSRRVKEDNLTGLRSAPAFRFVEADLASAALDPLLDGVDVVFHLAAQPGVRHSFGSGFFRYLEHNVQASCRLLEAASQRQLEAFVYASSSSVYGEQAVYPACEDAPLRPVSPYGATKVITEQLATAFWRSFGVPTVGLRYFTVYGPRQRPDMAFARFIRSALAHEPLSVLGDGRQVREFTYVGDVVRATIAAAERGERGSVYNVGGGQPVALLDVIALLEALLGRPLTVEHQEAAAGDPRRTEANVERAARDLGYRPTTTLAEGLAAQIDSLKGRTGRHRSGWLTTPRRDGRDRAGNQPNCAGSASSASSPDTDDASPRVLAYSHDGYGLGHLRRNLRILNGLRRQRDDVQAALVTGAKFAERLVAPFEMTCFRLPSVVKVGNGRYVADDQAASLAKVLRERSDMLEQTVRDFRPDLLLVDRYPRGMHDELARALGVYAVEQPGAPAVLGLRDILDHPDTIRREWDAQGNSRTIRDTYEMVLCYGDRSIYDPIREYGLPADVAERIRFTGYLADELSAVDRLELRRRHGVRDGRLAVCTLGGGKDAAFIAHSFISAIERLGRHGWSGVLITGPYMASEDVDRLRQATGVSVLRMVDDVPSYLAAADAVVCMGGYNTICEVLALAVPAVIIPRVQPRQEQLIRADRLGALGLLQWMHPSSLSPRLLAENIAELAEQPRAEVAARIRTIDRHGVQNSARHLAALLPAPVRADVTRRGRLSERESSTWVADGLG